MAGLPVLKKGGKIQSVVSSSDFEDFNPEIHALGYEDVCVNFYKMFVR